MELILIRHGQSLHNVNLTKELDSPLTDVGYQQAIETGEHLRKFNLSGFIGLISPYLRTLQTTELLNLDVDFQICNGIVEFLWENHLEVPENGKTIINREKWFPKFSWKNFTDKTKFYPAENRDSFVARIKLFLSSLSSDEKYIIISHASPVHAMIDLQTNDKCENIHWMDSVIKTNIKNCSITWFRNKEFNCFNEVVY